MNPIVKLKLFLKKYDLDKLYFAKYKDDESTSFRVLYHINYNPNNNFARKIYIDITYGLYVLEFINEEKIGISKNQEDLYSDKGYSLDNLIPLKEVLLMYDQPNKDKYFQKELESLNDKLNNTMSNEKALKYTKKN